MTGKEETNLMDIQQSMPVDVNDFIKSLPKDKQETATRLIFAMEQSIETSYNGPIPPPSYLKGYKDVLPNAPERILAMAEKQQEHRMKMEESLVERNLRLSERGQRLGFVIVILFLAASVFLAINGHENLAYLIMGTTLLGVLAVFVLNKLPWFNKDEEELVTEE